MGVDSVVFRSAPSILRFGVSRSDSLTGIVVSSDTFSLPLLLCFLLLLVLTIFTGIFFLITLDFVGVSFRCVEI